MFRAFLPSITYWTLIVFCYMWAIVQMFAGQPFDGAVLLLITLSYQTYRNQVLKDQRNSLFKQMDDE